MSIKSTYYLLTFLLIGTFFIYVSVGSYMISISDISNIILYKLGIVSEISIDKGKEFIVIQSRIPRAIVAILVGGSISVSGAAMQGLFRNPLADPGLIGVSSGASLSASLMIVFGFQLTSSTSIFGMYLMSLVTFLGACIAAFIVYRFATKQGKTMISMLLLAGIAIAAFSESIRGMASFYADEAQLKDLTFWLLGSLSGADWKEVWMLLPFTIIPIIFLPKYYKGLNSLALGETNASLLGVKTNTVKIGVIVFSTMAVGASVAAVGVISFIGLIIPHIVRLAIGSNHKHMMKICILAGTIVLLVSDLICRTLVAPSELPLGVITALVGAPIFFSILVNQRRKSIVI